MDPRYPPHTVTDPPVTRSRYDRERDTTVVETTVVIRHFAYFGPGGGAPGDAAAFAPPPHVQPASPAYLPMSAPEDPVPAYFAPPMLQSGFLLPSGDLVPVPPVPGPVIEISSDAAQSDSPAPSYHPLASEDMEDDPEEYPTSESSVGESRVGPRIRRGTTRVCRGGCQLLPRRAPSEGSTRESQTPTRWLPCGEHCARRRR